MIAPCTTTGHAHAGAELHHWAKTSRALARLTRQARGLVHFSPSNAALDIDACWIARHGMDLQEFPWRRSGLRWRMRPGSRMGRGPHACPAPRA
jgi:hypothetical protein